MTEALKTDKSPPVTSVAPIWIGLGLGFLFATPWMPYGLFVTVPLGGLIGAIVYSKARANAMWDALTRRHEKLARRLDDVQAELTALRVLTRAAEQPVSGSRAAAPEPAAEAAPGLAQFDTSDLIAPAMQLASQPPSAMSETLHQHPVSTASEDFASTPLPVDEPVAAVSGPDAASGPPAPPDVFERALGAAKDWLLGGNTVARIGLLVLFIGVAFLLRYVAERTHIPIEVRLLGVALGALAFLVFGWRLREQRPGFAITLQGGAIGLLYLTAFAALRLYAVLPPLAAFAFMALLAVLSGTLAILQNARALAALGAAGGFLAPILISTGEGRIALLFSYYLLLNLGVLGVAWFRAWRELNWIGFAFTFGVSGLWAVQRYTADQFVVGQGFLILFWLLFLVVSLLYALRQAGTRRGLFDTTLVFALPLAAFGIQTRFTKGFDLALAATIAAAVYLAASMWLMRRGDAALRLLTEATFGIGVAFLTLAIPLAASAQWTASAWALEGVALLWVGLRQQRTLPLAAGVLLHVLGAFALLQALGKGDVGVAARLSGFTVNLIVFAATAFLSARLLRGVSMELRSPTLQALVAHLPWGAQLVAWGWVIALVWQPLAFPHYVFAWCVLALALIAFDRNSDTTRASPEWVAGVAALVFAFIAGRFRLAPDAGAYLKLLLRLTLAGSAVAAALLSLRGAGFKRNAAAVLLTVGVIAWLIAVLAEVAARTDAQLALAQLGLALIAATALALNWLGTRLEWEWPRRLASSYAPIHVVFATYVVAIAVLDAVLPSRHYGWIVWPVLWVLYYALLVSMQYLETPVRATDALHAVGLWLLTAMVAAEIALRLDSIAGDGWFHAAWGVTAGAALWLTLERAENWPLRAAPAAYRRIGAPGLALFAFLWLLAANVHSGGDPAPLPRLPLINPMDIASLAVLGALLRWHLTDPLPEWRRHIRIALAGGAFFLLNVIALRAVHFSAGIGWNAAELGRSLIVQAVLSLLWTTTALALMIDANKRALRPLWVVGAALLGSVVAKLFLIDLSGQGTVERIVSFIGAGLLILLIGYFAPLPPQRKEAQS